MDYLSVLSTAMKKLNNLSLKYSNLNISKDHIPGSLEIKPAGLINLFLKSDEIADLARPCF
jgi:hypothetical protein